MHKMNNPISYLSKGDYIDHECKMLRQFDIDITEEIRDHLSDLYPNECAIGNYERTLIKNRLEK